MTVQHPKRWAWLIGIGIALFPIHNLWLTQLLTTKNGVTQAFIPAIGAAIWIIASLMFCAENFAVVQQAVLELNKKVIIPLLIIAGAISLSGLAQRGNGTFLDDLETQLAPFFTAVALLSVFVSARLLGKRIFYPLVIGSIVASSGVIIHAFIFPGQVTGGFVFGSNYDIVVGYIVLGAVLYIGAGRIWVTAFALTALFLTGSPEGIFSTAVLGVFLVVRELRKPTIRTFAQLVFPVIVIAGLWFGVGYGQELYRYTQRIITGVPTVAPLTAAVRDNNSTPTPPTPIKALSYRFEVIEASLRHVEPLGSGLVLTAFQEGIVHNVPLILVQQLGYPGIAGAVAWIWLCVWGLWKSEWKYGWLALVSLGLLDHFVWTQLAPLWWCVLGVSLGSWIRDDLILKKQEGRAQNDT